MSETSTPAKKKRTWKVFGFILGIAALIGLLLYFFFPWLDMKQVKTNISEFANNAEDPSQQILLEYILLQGVKEIRWNRPLWNQVKKVASTGGITIETAIVDAAVAQARDYGYIN